MTRKINLSAVIVAVLGVLVVCGTTWAGDLTDGLVSHWRFDESTGVTASDSAGNNHGVLLGDPSWATGQIGDGALDFDGDGDYVEIPDNDSLTPHNEITIAFWIYNRGGQSAGIYKYASCPNERYSPGNSRAYTLGVDDNGRADLRIFSSVSNSDSIKSDNIVPFNQWHHVAGTFNHGNAAIYIDGQLDKSTTLSVSSIMNDAQPLIIGGLWSYCGTDTFYSRLNGQIDEVTIWNRALSAEEVWQVCQEGLGELVNLEITGPNEVAEDFQTQYRAIAHYDNGGTSDVTASADWSVDDETIASITAGLLLTEAIDLPQDVIIFAEYTEGDNTQIAEKQVSVLTICPSGSALDFDGDGDYVQIPDDDSLTPNEQITISFWVFNRIGGYPIGVWKYAKCPNELFSPGNSRAYYIAVNDESEQVAMRIYTSVDNSDHILSNGLVTHNEWHHVAGTFDKGLAKLYIDGQIDKTETLSVLSIMNDNQPVTLGGYWYYCGADHFNGVNGKIDDVRIYKRALSAEEIVANMHTKLTGDEDGLVAYWDFDEGQGEIAGDLSGNGNDGTIVGAEWVQSDAPIGTCTPVAVDIKPGSCPNPLNLKSQGVLPVAILGSEDFDVSMIDTFSIRLEDVAAIRGSYEDVAAPVTDADECECSTESPDGHTDLTLKFKTQQIVEVLIDQPGELAKGQTLVLTLTGQLFDGTPIESSDCVKLVGNVPKWLTAGRWDANGDGLINMADFAVFAENWLQADSP